MGESKFKIYTTEIDGVFIFETTAVYHERLITTEFYSEEEFRRLGIDVKFVQENQICSKYRVIRGVDMQLEHPQGKLVRCLYGSIFDVAVDLRKNSNTYGKWVGIELSSINSKELYLPEGIAHGFLTISEYSEISFLATEFYHPEDHIVGVMWNDSCIGIKWPLKNKPILAEKDMHYPEFLRKEKIE